MPNTPAPGGWMGEAIDEAVTEVLEALSEFFREELPDGFLPDTTDHAAIRKRFEQVAMEAVPERFVQAQQDFVQQHGQGEWEHQSTLALRRADRDSGNGGD